MECDGTYISSKSLRYFGTRPLMIFKRSLTSRTLNIILCSKGASAVFPMMELYGLGLYISEQIMLQNSVGAVVC